MRYDKQPWNWCWEAVSLVQKYHHEYLTLEHILYAMSEIEPSKGILERCGADLNVLRAFFKDFFENFLEHLPEKDYLSNFANGEVPQTVSVQRTLQRAFRHMQSLESRWLS